tara:strand:- start:1114 stop:1485 length:372 start_codon:yes stop_codon:yes gene_type:complete
MNKVIFDKLAKSKFRSRFKLKEKEYNYVITKTIEIIRQQATDFINKRLADKYPKNDGKQTPMKNHPVFIAQHATATCCRTCLFKWHKISKNKVLSKIEIDYIVNIIVIWIEKQVDFYNNKVNK